MIDHRRDVHLGAEILPELLEKIRRMAEECDLVHGFQFVHNVSGGAGGGLGALLIDHIRQEYSDRMIKSYSVFPALSMSQIVVGRKHDQRMILIDLFCSG